MSNIQILDKMVKHTYTLKNGEVKIRYYPQNQYNKTHYDKYKAEYTQDIICNVCMGHYTIQNKQKHNKTMKHILHKKHNDEIEKIKHELQLLQQTQLTTTSSTSSTTTV